MADKSKIEWCMATWNFLVGCTKKSQGCMHCYAIRVAWRLMHNPNPKVAKKFAGTVERGSNGELNWTGRINFDEDTLALPLSMKLPTRIFVNSLSDIFHPNVESQWIAAAFAVMMATPHHTYQILTKHPERAAHWFSGLDGVADQQGLTPRELVQEAGLSFVEACHLQADMSNAWPLPNVQILTSVEDQPTANERIPWLLRIPAAVRGISAEPLLGPIDLSKAGLEIRMRDLDGPDEVDLQWVICGGESGPGARPMHPDWARSLRDQCVAADIPFFFKQWGAWGSCTAGGIGPDRNLNGSGPEWTAFRKHEHRLVEPAGRVGRATGDYNMFRVGKKAAGRLLDGREWDEYPNIALGGA